MLSLAKAFSDRPALGDRRAAWLGVARWSRGRRGSARSARDTTLCHDRQAAGPSARYFEGGPRSAGLVPAARPWLRGRAGLRSRRARVSGRRRAGLRRESQLTRASATKPHWIDLSVARKARPVPRGKGSADRAAVIGARLPRPVEGRGSQ